MNFRLASMMICMGTFAPLALAAKLVEVRTIDDEHVMVVFQDSRVDYKDDGKGKGAFTGHDGEGDIFTTFGDPLDLKLATRPSSYTVRSKDDPNFSTGLRPTAVFRKSKVSGTAWAWPDPKMSMEHTLFLRLPKKLKSGTLYGLAIGRDTKSDRVEQWFRFDIGESETEAIHVNRVGYNPSHTLAKSADLYVWLGDGGGRDYSSYVGRKVWLQNTKDGRRTEVGKVRFWKKNGLDFGNRNLINSDVWTCDFSAFTETGKYRLVVDGVGCSPEFELKPDVYFEPFRTSTRGFFYMRIGEPMALTPPPRQPRFIPGHDPEGFTIYMTTYGPWHPDWAKRGGDQWDNRDWSQYKEPGNPTNPNTVGGHSDAADWDRHAGHVSIIWDLLLPYIITNGQGGEDNLGIRESGNGIPDVIDEAQNEVDFWLSLRDTKGGYSAGLNNPSDDRKTMYQAAARPYMAWVSAANAAMLADAFRIAGKPALAAKYRDASLEAWRVANDQDLDLSHSNGLGQTMGRDLKQMAAAFLYNVTGKKLFEDALAANSVAKTGPINLETEKSNQLWGTAAYLACAKFGWRPINHPDLVAHMKASVLQEATAKNEANTHLWPSRRSSDTAHGWFQTVTEVQRVCVAHAFADSPVDRDKMLRALILEADYSLGRNPLNSVLMTGLGSRHVEDIYTSGQNDGVPGVHPGHTPYLNAEPWGQGFMADPKYMARRGYPEWEKWPYGEAYWRARYCYANNEFTPQQTMRGKHCLYAYLYALGK